MSGRDNSAWAGFGTLGWLLWCFWFTPALATAEAAPTEVAVLQTQIAVLQQRLAELEARLDGLPTALAVETLAAPAPSGPAPARDSWAERIRLKGDFRYRHESFDIEDRIDRHRHRIRARGELIAQIQDDVAVGFGLASGGDDPISSNQTLGSGESTKSVGIDLAYVTWDAPVDGLKLSAGKFKNPIHRVGGNSLLWDGDLRPEGVGLVYSRDDLFVNVLGSSIEESANSAESLLLGVQTGVRKTLADGSSLLFGLGYFDYMNIEGERPFFDGDPRGNQVNTAGNYLEDFDLIEAFVEFRTRLGEHAVGLFADFVRNTAARDYDTGYAVGVSLETAGGMEAGWTYQVLEPNAVLGLFTDSDFIGGGTDGEGHILSLSYPLSKRIGLAGTLFLNDRGVDLGRDESFRRFMLDISFKY